MRLIVLLAAYAAFSFPAWANYNVSCLNELNAPSMNTDGTEYWCLPDGGTSFDAREQWLAKHPNVMRISGVDDPVVAVSNTDSAAAVGNPTYDVATLDDVEPPAVTFLSPANLVQQESDQLIEVAATDNVGVLRIEISIDGYPYAVLENNWSVSWSVPADPNGSYEISATAIDVSGNYSTRSIRVFATR